MTNLSFTRFRHLGILGHSAEGAALCLRRFCQHSSSRIGLHQHPNVTLDCIAMGHSMDAWENDDYMVIRGILEASALNLKNAGAEFFVCPDNTAHIAIQLPGPDFPIPGLHIADVVACAAVAASLRKVGILGTKYLTNHGMYTDQFRAHSIDCIVPKSRHIAEINRIIFEELVNGHISEQSQVFLSERIDDFRRSECDSVALVCTELPMIINEQNSSLPILDSTTLLARSAFDVSCSLEPLPTWFGGIHERTHASHNS